MILFSRKYGESGPVLVILHGLFGQSDNWTGIARKLSVNHQVYTFDLRNHGESDHSEEFTYDLMADDVVETIEAGFMGEVHLIGHSMGGKVGMRVAQKNPQMLKSLMVVDIGPKYYQPHHQLIIKGLKSLQLGSLSSRNDADKLLSQSIPDFGTRQFLLKNLSRRSDNSFEWKFNLSGISENIEEVGSSLEDYGVSKVPALFYRGEKSSYIKDEDFEGIRTLFPNAEFKTMASAGHWLHAEKPEEMIQTIQDWTKENE